MQSSALPLGHAARIDRTISLSNRISCYGAKLLVLSNGHGEDCIALSILECLHQIKPSISLEVLPLVGEGKVFNNAIESGWLSKVGPSIRLPSGGFSNQSLSGLRQDISAGLINLTWQQWKYIRGVPKEQILILAVGDFLPLFLSWQSGVKYVFLGAPKSDYTWASGPGSSISDLYHRLKGSEWDPWEFIFMKSKRCLFVAARDKLTARGLRRQAINAYALGNPMMDNFQTTGIPQEFKNSRRILILCGSRIPEAYKNFLGLIRSVELVESNKPIVVFVALSKESDSLKIEELLFHLGFRKSKNSMLKFGQSSWIKGSLSVLIGPGQFNLWLSWSEVGLANAGTATEQLFGLGVPALSLPGDGPQFTKPFAKRQSRLLGGAITPCPNPELLSKKLSALLNDGEVRAKLGQIGIKRMGKSGGSMKIANLISKLIS